MAVTPIIISIYVILRLSIVAYSLLEDIQFVYSQLPRKQIETETGKIETSTCFDRLLSLDLIFMCKGNNNIVVFNDTRPDEILEFSFNFQVSSITFFKDGITVLIGNGLDLYLFSFVNDKKIFNQLLPSPVIRFYSKITNGIFNRDGSILFIYGAGGYICAYNKDFIQISNTYITKSAAIRSAQLLQDEQFILLSDDQNGLVILKILIKDNNSIELIFAANNSTIGWVYGITIKRDESLIFCFNIWRKVELVDLSALKLQLSNEQNYPIELPYKYLKWPIENMSPNVYCGQLSKDEEFLYLGLRSHGIMILDIKDINEPLLVQQIYVQGHSLLLTLSQSENHIIFSNGVYLYIFERITPNLNKDFPNFFNMHQSMAIHFQEEALFKWRCYIKENAPNRWLVYLALDVLISAFNIDKANKYTYDVQEMWNITLDSNSYSDSLTFTQDDNILYIPTQEMNNRALDAYNITNKFNQPEYISSLFEKDFTYHAEQIYASGNYIVMSYDTSIILVENNQLNGKDMRVVVRYEFKLPGSCVGAIVTKDIKYLIGALRDYGLVVVDISDKNNPFEADILQTFGAESLFPSNLYDIIYVADGMSGFKILDLKYLPKIKILGQYKLPGWTNHIELTADENYAIVSTMDYGMVTLLDICDKRFPVFLQKFQILKENAQATCIQKDLIFGLIMNQNPIRLLPLRSQIILNTEIALIDSQSNIKATNQKVFLVGQCILIHFTPLYVNENGKVTSIKVYQKTLGTTSDLPLTMRRQENGDIIFKIDKQSISEENTNGSPISTVTLIIEIQTQLTSKSFMMDPLQDKKVSEMTLNYLIEKGCLDQQNYLVENCKNQQIQLPNSISTNEGYIQYVNNKMAYSYFYNPVIIRISSSLKFDQSNSSSIIQSLSDKIILILTIEANSKSKFIDKTYENLIISYNNDFTQIKLEGSLSAMNKVLYNKIVIYTTNQEEIVSILLQDSINYEVNLQMEVKESIFLEIKQNLIVQIPIQEQIENLYNNAFIYVYEPFSFNIDKYTFFDKDQIKLQYFAFYLYKGKYISLDSATWIKFDQENLKLYGIPPQSSLFSTIYLKIVADNQSSTAEQEFYLTINRIPFSFVVYLALQILGPLAFLVSVYKYRINFFNALYRKRTIYSTEMAYVNQLYTKKILIVGDSMKMANLFFNKFLEELKKESKTEKKIQQSESQSRSFCQQNVLSKIVMSENDQMPNQLSILKKNSSIMKQQNEEIQMSQVNQQIEENEGQRNGDKCMITKQLDNQLQLNSFDNYNQKNNTIGQIIMKKIQSNLNFNQNSMRIDDNSLFLNGNLQNTFNTTDTQKQSNQFIKLIKTLPSIDIYEDKFLLRYLFTINSQNEINFDLMINKMISMNIQIRKKLIKININSYKDQLLDSNSMFHKCLITCAVRYILSQDKKLQLIINYMQKHSLKHYSYTINDWYKAYLEIIGQNFFNQNDQLILFPKILLKEKIIKQVFQKLNLIESCSSEIQSINKYGINFAIFKLCLEIKAFGLDNSNCKFMKKCSGESIHEKHDLLLSVEGFKKNQSKLKSFSKWLNRDYKRLPISKNMSLPSWISYDCKQGVLILEGIPHKIDQEQILIRIFDINHYILYQYFLQIAIKDNCSDIIQPKNDILSQSADQQIQQEYGTNNIQNQNSLGSSSVLYNPKEFASGNNSHIRLNRHLRIRKETFFKKQHLTRLVGTLPEEISSPSNNLKQYELDNFRLRKSRSFTSSLDIEDEAKYSNCDVEQQQYTYKETQTTDKKRTAQLVNPTPIIQKMNNKIKL